MNFINQKLNSLRSYLMFEDKKNNRRRIYSSIWAVIIGLFLSSLFYFIKTYSTNAEEASHLNINIFSFIKEMFKSGFDKNNRFDLLSYFLFFAFTGLAIAIAFKSGYFNIGSSGQMTLPAIVFFAIIISTRTPLSKVPTSYIVGMFFVFILLGFVVGAISGFLKAFFNVHEVISTIFLNWIICYLAQWLFTRGNSIFFEASDSSTQIDKFLDTIVGTQKIRIPKAIKFNFIYFGLALFAFLSVSFWLMYRYTTLGYKIKMIGLNRTNSQYVGVNQKLTTISVLGLSGALSGIAGFYYLIIYNGKISDEIANGPYPIAFEAIAIALLVLNSPIGISFSAILYSVIFTSKGDLQVLEGIAKVDKDFFPIITGLIIFAGALGLLFAKFKPLRFFTKYIYLATLKEYWSKFKTHKQKSFKSFILINQKRLQLFNFKYKNNSKLKQEAKPYHDIINQKLLEISKTDSDLEKMKLYDEIYKVKQEINQIYNSYSDLRNEINIEIAKRTDNKLIYANFKEDLYTQFKQRIDQKFFNKNKEEVKNVNN